MKKILRYLYILSLLVCANQVEAQLNCSATTLASFPAACPSQGKITVDTTGLGGIGSYIYRITAGPLQQIPTPPQSYPSEFTNLPAGTFTVEIRDSLGNICTSQATVTTNYIPMTTTLTPNGCQLKLDILGGKAPYKLERFNIDPNTNPNAVAVETHSPYNSLSYTFKKLPYNQTWIKVTDDCGITYVQTAFMQSAGNLSVGASLINTDSVRVQIYGTIPPTLFKYKIYVQGVLVDSMITSSKDVTFNDIVSPCGTGSTYVEVTDTICRTGIAYFNLAKTSPILKIDCVNFQNKTASLSATGGTPPYTFDYYYNTSISTSGVFSNLPFNPNTTSALFRVTDHCGKSQSLWVYNVNTGLSLTPNLNCGTSKTTLNGYFTGAANYPVTMTNGTQSVTVTTSYSSFSLPSLTSGNIDVTITDKCGNQAILKDSLSANVVSSCADITASVGSYIVKYKDTNGYIGSSNPTNITANYVLYNSVGAAIDSNSTGIFTNLANGAYKVKIKTNCGLTAVKDVTISPAAGGTSTPMPSSYVAYYCENGQIKANLTIYNNGLGPYTITNTTTGQSFTSSQGGYYFNSLPMGTYSVSSCASGNSSTTLTAPPLQVPQYYTSVKCIGGQFVFNLDFYQNSLSKGPFTLRDSATNTILTSTNGNNFTNLPAGTYYVTSGCAANKTIKISNPASLPVDYYAKVVCSNAQYSYQISSNNTNLGPFIMTNSNGTTITSTNNGNTFSNISPGTYTISSGCTTPTTITLPPFPTLPLIKNTLAFNCPGIIYIKANANSYSKLWETWAANVLATTGKYIYPPNYYNNCNYSQGMALTLTTAAGGTVTTTPIANCDSLLNVVFPNLNVGSYKVKLEVCGTVIDEETVVIKSHISPTAKITRGIVCDGLSTADIRIFITSNSPPYTIEQITCGTNPSVIRLITITEKDSVLIKNLPIGDYCYRIKDGCGASITTATQVALIGQINPNYSKKCGEITFTIDKVYQGTYKWREEGSSTIIGTTDSISVVAKLTPTKYIVEIFIPDANCTITRELSVAAGLGVIPQVTITRPAKTLICNGASITISAALANNVQHLMKWQKLPSAVTIGTGSNLTINQTGLYKVIATNQYGCFTEDTISIKINTPVIATLTPTSVKCKGEKSGKISSNVSGGVNPYIFAYSNGATSANIDNLAAGVYQMTVTDNLGCTATADATVSEPTPLQIVVTELNQKYCSPILSFGINGGTPPYTILVDGVALPVNILESCLTVGNHIIKVKDANDCDSTFTYFFKKENHPVKEVIANVCFGESYPVGSNIYNISGTYTDTLRGNQNCGTCDTVQKTILTINAQIIASASASKPALCLGDKTNAQGAAQGGTGIYTYLWSNNATSNTISNLSQGTYLLTVTDTWGCKAISSVTVTEYDFPKINITGDDKLCKGGQGSLQANITNFQTGNSFSYQWTHNGLPFANSATIVTSKAGTYAVTVTNGFTQCTGTATFTISDADKWIPEIVSYKKLCRGENITLEAKVGQGTQITWYKDNNILQQFNNQPIITVSEGGNYRIEVKKGLCEGGSEIFNVVMYENPVLEITPSEKTICPNTEIKAKAISATAISYIWSNGSNQTEINVTSGVHRVTVVDANGCKATKDVVITEFSISKPNFEPIKQICNHKDSVSIAIKEIFENYTWSTGSTLANIKVTAIGTYTVTVTDKNGCTTTNQVEVKNANVTQPILAGPKEICTDNEAKVSLQNPTAFKSFAWQDGSTKTDYIVKGKDSLTINTIDFNGCLATAVWKVEVLGIPDISFNVPIVCEGSSGVLEITQKDYTYLWEDESKNKAITVNKSGTYYVTITDKNGCTNEKFVVFETKKNPVVTIEGSSQICKGDTVLLYAQSQNIRLYEWNTLDTTAEIKVFLNQNYSITVTDYNGCIGNANASLSFADSLKPILPILKVCEGTNAILDAGGGYSDYFWLHNGAKTRTTIANKTGNYRVLVKNGNCAGTGTVELVVLDNPMAVIKAAKDTICYGTDAQLSTDFKGIIRWETGEFNIPVITKKAGTYSLFVEDNNGCKDTSKITIIEKPIFKPIMPDVTVCIGEEAILTPSMGKYYLWQDGSVSNIFKTQVPDNYSVTITDKDECLGFVSAKVANFGAVTTSISANKTKLCIGEEATLFAKSNSSNASFSWSNNEKKPQISVSQGIYFVTATDKNGCTASDSITLKELPQVSVKILIDKAKICKNEQARISITWKDLAQNNANLTLRIGNDLLTLQNINKDTSWLISPSKSTSYNIQVASIQGGDCDVFFNKNEVSILKVSELTSSITAINPTCYGLKGKINLITNAFKITPSYNSNATFLAGTYTFKMQDSLGCILTETVEIKEPNPIEIELIAKPTCHDETKGVIEIQIFEGYAPFHYVINDVTTSESVITDLALGKYKIYVSDKNGCTSSLKEVEIKPFPITRLQIVSDTNYVRKGDSTKVTASIFVDNQPINDVKTMQNKSFKWLPNGCDNCTSFFAKPNTSTNYTLKIVDKNGCKVEDSVEIEAGEVEHCYATPTGITDNGNLFTILDPCKTIKLINVLEIFDQLGNKVYRVIDFEPNRKIGWDGIYRGEEMNAAVFTWRAVITYIDDYIFQAKGDVSLVR